MTAVPFLVLQRGRQVLGSISGSDAGKIKELVEKHAGKAGDINAGAATGGSGSEGVGAGGKVSLPPALEATPRANGVDDADVTGGHEKGGASSANGNIGGTVAPPAEDPAEELNNRLAELVKAAPVMLFMKGTPSAPQCGFSRTLVGLLREKGVRYGFFNILADEEVRQGLKVFSYVFCSFFLLSPPPTPPTEAPYLPISFLFKNSKKKTPQKNTIKLLIPLRT